MIVDVVIEQRFYRCTNGKYWTDNAFANLFWQRYLTVFSHVNIVARVRTVNSPDVKWQRVDGDNISFTELPFYIGPIGFIKTIPSLLSQLRARQSSHRAVVYRVPSILSAFYHWFALPKGQNYAAEVVGDPLDVFAQGASQNPFRVFFKWMFVRLLTRQCRGASAISYVTEYSLQERYPPAEGAHHTHYSSIQLMDADYQLREEYPVSSLFRLVCIGNLSQPYKGCDYMLSVLAHLKKLGRHVHLTWIGGGALQEQMQDLAHTLDVGDIVNFVGNVAQRADINSMLDDADAFVLSSRQEGLPRVLIESMARSLTCVATNVGGVKELLPEQHIVERDNVEQMVAAITALLDLDEQSRLSIGQRNFEKASEYHNDVLSARREGMYEALKKATAL